MTTTGLVQLLLVNVFSYMALGYILGRMSLVSMSQIRFVLKWVVVFFLFPVLIFQNTIEYLDLRNIYQAVIMFFAALIMVLGSHQLVRLLYVMGSYKVERRVFILGGSIHNYGFAVYPLVLGVLGNEALPMTFVFIITCDALFWAFGGFILSGDDRSNKKIPLSQIISPPLVALVLAVLIVALEIHVFIPGELLEILSYPGKAAIPGALTCIGGIVYFSLNDSIGENKLHKAGLVSLLCFRNLCIPILWLGLLYFIPIENNLKAIIGIEAVMPSSIGIIFLARMYDADTRFTSIFSIISNALSVISVPVLLGFMLEMVRR